MKHGRMSRYSNISNFQVCVEESTDDIIAGLAKHLVAEVFQVNVEYEINMRVSIVHGKSGSLNSLLASFLVWKPQGHFRTGVASLLLTSLDIYTVSQKNWTPILLPIT